MSPRLLVVDDDAALNLALCAHFEDRGWRATGAPDCAAALAATASATFEVVLLDVHLPDGDGVELLGRLLERDPHLPAILMTGGRDVERAMQAIAAGAFDWPPEPFGPVGLERLVDRAMPPARRPPPTWPKPAMRRRKPWADSVGRCLSLRSAKPSFG